MATTLNTPSVSSGMVVMAVVISALPALAVLFGLDLNTVASNGGGEIIHGLLEWTALGVAVFVMLMAVLHYSLRGDITIAVIGLAIICSGVMDGFHVLGASGIFKLESDPANFVAHSWTLNRVLNAVFLGVSVLVFMADKKATNPESKKRGLGFLLVMAVVFCAAVIITMGGVAICPDLPQAIYPEALLKRPYELIPLGLYLVIGAYIMPSFNRWHSSRLSNALWISLIPCFAAEMHMTFGSSVMYDTHFYIAHALKIVAYFIPLHGLKQDYTDSYRLEKEAKSALAKELLMKEEAMTALNHDRKLLSVIIGHSSQAISVKDASLRYVRVNEQQAMKLGLDQPQEAVGHRAGDFLSREVALAAESIEERVLLSGEPEHNVYPLNGKANTPVGVVVISSANNGT